MSNIRSNIVIANDKILKDEISPRFAYYLLLNTTDRNIRRKLLSKVIDDSTYTLMFLINCVFEDEANIAINYILNEPFICLELLNSNKRLNKNQRSLLIKTIIKDIDATKLMLDMVYIEEEYRINILNLYNNILFKERTVSNYFNNWNLFGNIIGKSKINDLVLLIINSNTNYSIEIDMLLLYCKLTNKQKDLLTAKKISILLG